MSVDVWKRGSDVGTRFLASFVPAGEPIGTAVDYKTTSHSVVMSICRMSHVSASQSLVLTTSSILYTAN